MVKLTDIDPKKETMYYLRATCKGLETMYWTSGIHGLFDGYFTSVLTEGDVFNYRDAVSLNLRFATPSFREAALKLYWTNMFEDPEDVKEPVVIEFIEVRHRVMMFEQLPGG